MGRRSRGADRPSLSLTNFEIQTARVERLVVKEMAFQADGSLFCKQSSCLLMNYVETFKCRHTVK